MLLEELTWPAVASLSKDTPVLVPIAALEQHGHHLPLMTDSMLLQEIVRRVEAAMSAQILVTPLMWLGNSDHHLDFSGTLSCPPRVYLDLLNGIVDNLISHGFRRILLLNGHGGNDVPGKQAMFEVRQRYRSRSDLLLLFSTYWSLGEGRLPTPQDDPLQQSEMGHACEWETSMILRIAPHLVGNYRETVTVEPGRPFAPASRAWITKDRTLPGHIGSPQWATAEKGERLFTAFSNGSLDLLQKMIQWDGSSWEG
jgi:creatinine amidohydrolase